jgi:hypothetical protein
LVRGWACEHSVTLAENGIEVSLSFSPGRLDKKSCWIDLDSSHRITRVTFWDTGEVEFMVADMTSGDIIRNEHREITSPMGLEQTLSDGSSGRGRKPASPRWRKPCDRPSVLNGS